MHFAERVIHDCRIYAGAIEAEGGYTAGVVVKHRPRPGADAIEVFHDTRLACGHRWADPQAALRYALARGIDFAEWHHDQLELKASEQFLQSC